MQNWLQPIIIETPPPPPPPTRTNATFLHVSTCILIWNATAVAVPVQHQKIMIGNIVNSHYTSFRSSHK